ncbi:MAG: GerMN domain-containing protein [Syntrophales bacterium]
MSTKKKRKTDDIKAKRRKKNTRFFFLFLIVAVFIGSFVFLFFTLSDFVDFSPSGKSSSAKKKEKMKVVLYFSDANERFLVAEKRLIPKSSDTAEQAEELIKALIDGPRTDLVRTLPEGTKLKGVRMENATARVDFDGSLIEQHPGGSTSEVATIYSLVNSLTANFPDIKSVKITVDGKDIETLKGHIDTRQPIFPDKEMIAQGTAPQ